MTKRFLSVFAAASLMAVLTPLSVATSASEVNCRIPFSFTVNGTTLPAGAYSVSTQRAALLISGFTHGAIILGNPMESRTETGSKLVFEKYGDQYTLREVWMGGREGRELPLTKSDRDRRTARDGHVERIVINGM